MTRDGALAAVADLVTRESGIRIVGTQEAALRAALQRTLPGVELVEAVRNLRDPALGPPLLARLLDEVTVKETYFLRDRVQLEQIDWHALLERARRGGGDRIRVWTAACATGEEAYTLALLAAEAFAPAPPPVTVLATDISGAALARAREGVYRARSVRELDAGQRARYFEARGDQLAAGERLRALVTFARHNLTADPPPAAFGPFHLILCRNVLIYFDGHTVAQVLGLLSRALVPGGMLVLGAADALCAGAVRLGPLSVEPLAPVAPPVQRRRALRRPLGRERADAATSADGQAPADRLRSDDPFDAHGDFLRGLAALERDEPQAAVQSLRRALFAAPRFALAAFTLGRAHEAAGDRPAARRAYEQALRTLTGDDAVEGALLEHVDADEVIAAARARLAVLSA